MKKLLTKLFSDIRTYFVLFVIALFSLGFWYRHIQEGYKIVEVLETKTEPSVELKITKLQLDRANITVDDAYQKTIIAPIITTEKLTVFYTMIIIFLMVHQPINLYH